VELGEMNNDLKTALFHIMAINGIFSSYARH
jgi:hypothetical protein